MSLSVLPQGCTCYSTIPCKMHLHGIARLPDEPSAAQVSPYLRDAEAALAAEQLRCKVAEERRDALSGELAAERAELKRINPLYTAACIGQRDAERQLAVERAAREAAFRQGVQLGKVEAQQQIERAEQERDAALAKAAAAQEACAKAVDDYEGPYAAKVIRSLTIAPDAGRKIAEDAKRLQGLLELCGHVQNASDVTVRLYQDDACRSYRISVGKRCYFGNSWFAAIDAALRGETREGG